jgi:ribosomal protein S18 acetylase RimI-like enzyme
VASLTPGLAEIKRIYIRPSFRRQGLARTLTLALADQARLQAFQTVGICTWADNTSALKLYQQLGFAPIASFREPEKSHLVFLGLSLASADQDAT